MNKSRIHLVRTAPLLAGLLGFTAAHAVPTYTIGNGPDSSSYINAVSLANTMAFTSVTISADSAVTVADPVDLSTSLFGPTLFDLFLQAPTVSIDGKLTMGAGNVYLNAQTVNLNDVLDANDGSLSLLDTTRILGSGTTTINVNGAGSVDQAVALALDSIGSPVTLNLLGGDHSGDSLQAFGNLSATMSGGSVAGATISSGGLFDWTGGQILSGVLLFSGTFNIYGGAFQIAAFGDCAITPEGSWQAAPAQLNNQAQCVRGIFADGSTFRTAVNSIGTTNFIGVSVVPVPAAVWLFGSAMAGLGFLRRRG